MKMNDVRVGMRLRPHGICAMFGCVTVTELTERGFKYRLDAPRTHIAREGSWIPVDGHEHFGFNGEALFEPENIE